MKWAYTPASKSRIDPSYAAFFGNRVAISVMLRSPRTGDRISQLISVMTMSSHSYALTSNTGEQSRVKNVEKS